MNSGKQVATSPYAVLLLLCCAVTCAFYFLSYMRIPVVPLYARSIGATTFQIGAINAAFLLVAGVLSLPLGLLSDRLGRKRLILVGLLIVAATSVLLCFSTTPSQMGAVYLLFGVGLAAFAPTMMSFVADFSPATHLGRSYGWYTLAVYGGMSLGPAAGGLVAEWMGFQWVFSVSGVLTLGIFAWVFWRLPRARHVLIDRSPKRPTRVVAGELARNLPLLACWLATLGGCIGLGLFVTFVPLYARDQGVKIGEIGLIFAAQGLCNALSRIPFGRLSDRVGRRSNLVVAGLFGFAASLAAFALAARLSSFILCAMGVGVSMGVAFTAVGALISEVVSPDSRGLAMGGYNSTIYFGMTIGSLVMGAVIREVGFRNTFFLVAGVNLVATGLFHMVFQGTASPGKTR
jgi:MFS family permease